MTPEPPDPIDAVITWVDGDDPVLRAKRIKYLGEGAIAGAEATRFASADEIVYCVLSILKNAPWFENIYIVTDAQIPPVFEAVKQHFPEQLPKIKIIDHTEIFRGFAHHLPSFNSISISMLVHKIPDLNERFVFFNDDVFLVRDVKADEFFAANKPVLRGAWMGLGLRGVELLRDTLNALMRVPKEQQRFGSKRVQLNAARVAGFSAKTFIAMHTPHPMRVSTMAGFAAHNQARFEKNLSFRVRHLSQIGTEALANHLELFRDNALVQSGKDTVYIRAEREPEAKVLAKLARIEQDPEIKILCVQSLDNAPQTVQTDITNWLNQRFKP